MKLIIAVIQPNKLEAVKAALTEVDVFRLTVMDCQGFGRQKGQTEVYRGHEFTVNLPDGAVMTQAVDINAGGQIVGLINLGSEINAFFIEPLAAAINPVGALKDAVKRIVLFTIAPARQGSQTTFNDSIENARF